MPALTSPPGVPHEIVKHPNEVLDLYAEFSALIGANALTGTPTVTPASGLTTASAARNGSRVEFRCSGGTAATDYLVTITCGDDSGQTHVIQGRVKVRTN